MIIYRALYIDDGGRIKKDSFHKTKDGAIHKTWEWEPKEFEHSYFTTVKKVKVDD